MMMLSTEVLNRDNCFPFLNKIKGKTEPYRSKDVVRHYYYRSYTNLGPGVVDIITINFHYHACIKQSSLPLDSKIEDECNQTRYGRVYDCK